MSNTKRQQNIINYIQSKGKVANAEILDFLDNTIERTTLQRDLNLLLKKGLITKSGSGRSTAYSISKINKISLPINIEEYFNTLYYFK